jgi:hypothetical protein
MWTIAEQIAIALIWLTLAGPASARSSDLTDSDPSLHCGLNLCSYLMRIQLRYFGPNRLLSSEAHSPATFSR